MLVTRRTMLATGALAGIGGVWTGMSSSWTARFLRERLAEIGREVPPAPYRPHPETWNDNAITLAWLGHATVLVNFYGLWIITDPVLFPRIGVDLVVGSLGPRRLVHCALAPGGLLRSVRMADTISSSLLVAMPQLGDPNFRRSVVQLVHHDAEGAFGLVVNRRSELTAREICADHDIQWAGRDPGV